MAFTIGGVIVSDTTTWLGPELATITSPWVAFVVAWFFQRIWLWGVLPPLGWVAGRMLDARPERFALVAGLSGEAFSLLMATARDGVEMAFLDWIDVLARVVTLAVGLGLTALATQKGRRGAEAAQARAEATAVENAAEYAEMMAKAEAQGRPPDEPTLPPSGL